MADYSAPKKTKPSKSDKKHERNSKLTEKFNSILNSDQFDENGAKEPYKCTGRFIDDFPNLCKQLELGFIPPVIHRQKRAQTPTISEHKTKSKKTAHSSILESNSLISQNEQQTGNSSISQKQNSIVQILDGDENKDLENIEPLPKTFVLVKDRSEYFKPKIQVEMETIDKQETITEIYVRGWKIEQPILNIFHQSLPLSDKISTLNLWYCGLNGETLGSLADLLAKCPNLKNIALDGNPINDESYYKLLNQPNSPVEFLSLRSCQITDVGIESISSCLGALNGGNKKLLNLNLSGNMIGDNGASQIAQALRNNRTLLVLNLSGNQITDIGAKKLAESLSRFKMTHEEILKRRQIKRERFEREFPMMFKKKGESTIDRGSSQGFTKTGKESKMSKKADSALSLTQKDKAKNKESQASKENLNDKQSVTSKQKKDKESLTNTNSSAGVSKKDKSREGTASVISEKGSKASGTKKGTKKTKDSDSSENEMNVKSLSGTKISGINSLFGDNDPMMDEAEGIDGDLWLVGNRTLISLNLSRNKIGQEGLRDFLLSVQYQITLTMFQQKNNSNFGLLKLNLSVKIQILTNHEDFLKLTELMKSKDPIANKSDPAPDNASLISKDGKETNRSKSSVHK